MHGPDDVIGQTNQPTDHSPSIQCHLISKPMDGRFPWEVISCPIAALPLARRGEGLSMGFRGFGRAVLISGFRSDQSTAGPRPFRRSTGWQRRVGFPYPAPYLSESLDFLTFNLPNEHEGPSGKILKFIFSEFPKALFSMARSACLLVSYWQRYKINKYGALQAL